MKRNKNLLPLVNFFAKTLRETLDVWHVSQAKVSRMTGIPSPQLTDMKKCRCRCFGASPGFWLRFHLDYELMRGSAKQLTNHLESAAECGMNPLGSIKC